MTRPRSKELGNWLNTPFDNTDYVGTCWVSAWLVHSDDSIGSIGTLYGPFAHLLVEIIEAAGEDMSDIKNALMTQNPFDHSAGTAARKLMLLNTT